MTAFFLLNWVTFRRQIEYSKLSGSVHTDDQADDDDYLDVLKGGTWKTVHGKITYRENLGRKCASRHSTVGLIS